MFSRNKKKNKRPLDNRARVIRLCAVTGIVVLAVAMVGLAADQKRKQEAIGTSNSFNLLNQQVTTKAQLPDGLYPFESNEANKFLFKETYAANQSNGGGDGTNWDRADRWTNAAKNSNQVYQYLSNGYIKFGNLTENKKVKMIEKLGWSITTFFPNSANQKGVQVDFLNAWNGFADDYYRDWDATWNPQTAWQQGQYIATKQTAHMEADLPYNHWRTQDFLDVDLITGRGNKNGVSAQNLPKTRYGQGNFGALGEVNWDDFYNSSFQIMAVMEESTSSKHYYSDGTIRDGNNYLPNKSNLALPSPLDGKKIVNWSALPFMDQINEQYKKKIEELSRKNPGRKIIGKLSSLLLWIPYEPIKTSWSQPNWINFKSLGITIREATIDYYIENDTVEIATKLANAMRNHFPSQIKLVVDDGANKNNAGIKLNDPLEIAPGGESSKTKFEKLMKEQWASFIKNSNIAPEINKPHINADFLANPVKSDRFDLWLTIHPDGGVRMGKLVAENIAVTFENSELYNNWMASKNAASRVKIEPGKTVKWENNQFLFTDDEPFKVEEPNPNNRFGGTWLYHSNLTINFSALAPENEVIFVNEQPVDVEDLHFKLRLIDNIITDPNTGKDERKNKYEIKIVIYNQDSNGVNTSIKTDFSFKIMIEAIANDFPISYFGWNPEKNPDQKDLITEFILDPVTGEPIRDENGAPIPNPKYDPLIDPATGVKKELVWVNKKTSDANFNRLKFLPDPKDKFDQNAYRPAGNGIGQIDPETNFGFIAEAFVIPKGINITDQGIFTGNGGDPLLNKGIVEIGKKEISQWSNVAYGNENTYLSKSGVYLFTDDVRGSLSTIKLVGYGVDAKKPQLFTDVFVDNSDFGWMSLWDSYQGLHLLKYLTQILKMEEKAAKELNYPQISNFWKQYVSWAFLNDIPKDMIYPVIDAGKVNEYTKTVNRNDFNPSSQIRQSWLGEFENKDKIDVSAKVIGPTTVELRFSVINVNVGGYMPEPKTMNVPVRFKDTVDPSHNGTKLNLNIDENYIIETIKKTRTEDFQGKTGLKIMDIFKPSLVLKENQDKIGYDALIENNKIKFIFSPLDKDKYWLAAEDQKRYFENNLIPTGQGITNIFEHFGPSEFNLKGRKLTINDIKTAFSKFVLKNMLEKYVLDVDYEIVWPSDEQLQSLTTMSSIYDQDKPFQFIKLQVKENRPNPEYYGIKQIQVFNAGDLSKPQIDDLSQLRLKDLIYKFNNPFELKEAIIKDLNEQLDAYDLELDLNVYIVDFDQVVQSLFITTGTRSVNLILKSDYEYLQNYATVRVTNTTNQAINFDLSQIVIPPLEFQLTKQEEISKQILDHLNLHLYNKFGLSTQEIDVFYQDGNDKLALDSFAFLRSLVAKNPPEWTIIKEIKVVGKIDNLKNSTQFNITNRSGDQPYDPDTDDSWKPPAGNPGSNNFWNKNGSSILGGIFGSLGTMGALFGGVMCFKYFYKQQSKSIK